MAAGGGGGDEAGREQDGRGEQGGGGGSQGDGWKGEHRVRRLPRLLSSFQFMLIEKSFASINVKGYAIELSSFEVLSRDRA